MAPTYKLTYNTSDPISNRHVTQWTRLRDIYHHYIVAATSTLKTRASSFQSLSIRKLLHWFLSRVSTLTRDINTTILSVCPSYVRDTLVLYENGLTYSHSSFFLNHSSFTSIKHLHEIPTGSPPAGALNTGGVYKLRDFLPISRYISQTSHSYYGRRIGTRMRSIKWCHFQWPWTNPNPVFKATPLYDAKYLTNPASRWPLTIQLFSYSRTSGTDVTPLTSFLQTPVPVRY